MTALIELKDITKTFLTEEIETRAINTINITINNGPPPKERKSAKGKPIKKIIKYAKSAIRLTFRCQAGGVHLS